MKQSEKLIKIISKVSKKEGFLKYQSYRLILTDQRIIFAKATKEILKAEEKAFNDSLKGKSFKERMVEIMMENKRIYDKYQNMSFDSILDEALGNFYIDIDDISKVKVPLMQTYNNQGQHNPKPITLYTNSGEYFLKFNDAHEAVEAHHFLKSYIK